MTTLNWASRLFFKSRNIKGHIFLGITQCDKLWQDIVVFIDSDGSDPYFFGTIIINCLENDRVLSLIDEQ